MIHIAISSESNADTNHVPASPISTSSDGAKHDIVTSPLQLWSVCVQDSLRYMYTICGLEQADLIYIPMDSFTGNCDCPCASEATKRHFQIVPQVTTIMQIVSFYNMTVWILAGNGINFP